MSSERQKRYPVATQLPDWTPEQLDQLASWLAEQGTLTHRAAQRLRCVAIVEGKEFLRANADYYRHATGAIRWLRATVSRIAAARRGGNGSGRRES